MRISLNWLKKYVDINVENAELEKLIDSRLVEIEEIIDESKKYENIFVVEVVECEAIPETHLHLCKINAGNHELADGTGLVQVVCGAPNVHAGMLAAWIAPGAIVPASVNEDAPFVIGKRKMLGKYDSYGMLAGADELDFSTDHAAIIEIDPAIAKPGDKFADVFELNDAVLDIENKSLTHRPDCFGLIGFAREVAGVLGQKFDSDSIEEIAPIAYENAEKSVSISDPEICSRYSAVVLKKHGEIKKKYFGLTDTILAKAGMRPVDPIVDATNYLMLLTGQPLHAFDYDKFLAVGGTTEPKIGVRLAKEGEKLVLLDDSEIELVDTDIVITSNDIPVALAGAMGGKSTMIDENTKNVIIESAAFSLFNLRKTQMAHGIFSEAITRFTKGQPAYQTVNVALHCADLLKDGFVVEKIIDSGYEQKDNVVKITTPEINGLLGTNYSNEEIVKTLENVEFKVAADGDNLTVAAPAWRTDIHIKEDIIEEIGRLNGYDNIAPVLPAHATAEKNKMVAIKSQIRNFFSLTGANELLTYTFVHGDLLEKVGQDIKNSYRLVNSISPELQYLRQQIVPSLLVKAHNNLKAKYSSFALFEMNQTFSRSTGVDEDGVPIANNNLAMVVADNSEETKYYLAKKYVEELGKKLGITLSFKKFVPVPKEAFYEPKRSASIYIGDTIVGCIGEIKNSVLNKLKLPRGVAAFEISLEALTEFATLKKAAPEISDYPTVSRDITVITDAPYESIFEKLQDKLESHDLVFKLVPTSIYQAEGAAKPSLSFHLEFADKNKTLESAEILAIMDELEKIA